MVLSLWLLVLLTIFSVNIGLRIRRRVELVNRIEQRMKLHHAAASGVKKSISVLKHCLSLSEEQYSAYTKNYLRNNPQKFKRIEFGLSSVDVSYRMYGSSYGDYQQFYGFIDEESKINLNVASREVIQRLVSKLITSDEDDALFLADSIIDWRTFGKSRIDGFPSEDYYSHLEYPYDKRSAPYEVLDELLLVQGINEKMMERLRPFVTVYGSGAVNINTASKIVLQSLGFSDELVDKIISVRNGSDGLDSTLDDHIFVNAYDIASEMSSFLEISETEAREIDNLNSAGIIKTNSFFYFIESIGKLKGKAMELKASCVFDSNENRIVYYNENN